MKLSELVRPDTMIARSVNLERDLGDPGTLDRYLLTGKGLEIVARLTAGLNGEKVSAWSLTGPYGMGKSAFVHFLLSICGSPDDPKTRAARGKLVEKDSGLADRLENVLKKQRIKTKGFFQVPATAAFEPLNKTLAAALSRAVGTTCETAHKYNEIHDLNAAITDFLSTDDQDSTRLVELFQDAARISRSPVALVVDEFGKNLEYLSRHPARGDLFILQTLAETENIFLWVCLHQAFEAYAAGLTRNQRQEWGKVQGRFEDISFVEPRAQMLDFIGETLIRSDSSPKTDRTVQDWAVAYDAEARRLGVEEIAGIGPETMARFFPLHPLTAVVLPELCTRFAQNDRTLFAFLCGGEPNGLPAFLNARDLESENGFPPTFGPERLYAYFLGATSALSLSRPGASRWLEIHDMVEGARNLPDPQRDLLKTIGLLNLVSGPSGFRASRNLLRFALFRSENTGDADLEDILAPLSEKGILVYREYADEYRLWEGTDIDIPAAIEAHKPVISARSLESLLEKAAPQLPLIASRHSYRTGTLRQFERRWCGVEDIAAAVNGFDGENADGLLLYAFGNEPPKNEFPEKTLDGHPVLVAFARAEDRLRERTLDAAAAAAILTESPELARDGVARREARFRAGAAEERLKSYLADLFTPGNPEVLWQSGDRRYDLRSMRDLSGLLSRLSDQSYRRCPVIRNELINRERLSAAAARARRELVQAMLTGENRENLGLSGTGPEVAIYRTMLLAEGIHQKGEDGIWRFLAPAEDCTFGPAWTAIEEMMKAAGDRSVPVTEMIDLLHRPPFGMKSGPIPILICLYLLVRSEEAALFQEGAFLPFLGPEDLELMVKRPGYFAIKRFSPLGIQWKVFQVYQELLGAAGVSPDREMRNASMVNIVGPLVQFAGNLTSYVKQTRTVSREARVVLQRLLNAKDPIDLLFTDLPKAVGVPAFPADGPASDDAVARFQERLRDAIADLAQAYGRLVDKIGMVIREAFGTDEDLASLRADLRNRAAPLEKRCGDERLKPFVAVLTRDQGDDTEWLAAVATIASQRPVDSWRDRDLPAFSTRMFDLSRRFLAMERLVAEAERQLPEEKNGKEARLISLARPDGNINNRDFLAELSL